jgi:hypothetical protein
LLGLYGALGIANVVRGIAAFTVAPVFVSPSQVQPLSVDLRLLGAIYLAWGIALLATALHYVRRRQRPPRALAAGVGVGYQATLWLIRLIGYRASYARMLWRRDFVLSILFFIAIALLTWPFQRRGRRNRRG